MKSTINRCSRHPFSFSSFINEKHLKRGSCFYDDTSYICFHHTLWGNSEEICSIDSISSYRYRNLKRFINPKMINWSKHYVSIIDVTLFCSMRR